LKMTKSSGSGNPFTNLEKAINDFLSSGSLKAAVFRANDIFSFGTKVLAALAFTAFLSTTFLNNTTVPHITTSKVYLVKGQGSGLTGDRDYYDNSGNDQAFINFDLKADLSPLFNWNVKALYLYLTAEYKTETNVLNEMVLWDKIVMNGEKMELDMKSAKTKYYFRNYGKGLLGHDNITLILNWNVMPNMGDLKWVKSAKTYSFKLPTEYYSTMKRGH